MRKKLLIEKILDGHGLALFDEASGAPRSVAESYNKLSPQSKLKTYCDQARIGMGQISEDMRFMPPEEYSSAKMEVVRMAITADFAEQYLDGHSEIYHIAPEFSKGLAKASANIRLQYLIDNIVPEKVYHIQFSRPICTYSGEFDGVFMQYFPHHSELQMMYQRFDDVGCIVGNPGVIINTNFSEDPNPTVEELMSFALRGTINNMSREEMLTLTAGSGPQGFLGDGVMGLQWGSAVRFSLLCLLYIVSGDPDIKREPAKKTESKNPKKMRLHARAHCPFDVTNVGYAFHGRHYTVGSTVRRAHPRWQPYGPERSKVKLIWIDEHEVHYNQALTK